MLCCGVGGIRTLLMWLLALVPEPSLVRLVMVQVDERCCAVVLMWLLVFCVRVRGGKSEAPDGKCEGGWGLLWPWG